MASPARISFMKIFRLEYLHKYILELQMGYYISKSDLVLKYNMICDSDPGKITSSDPSGLHASLSRSQIIRCFTRGWFLQSIFFPDHLCLPYYSPSPSPSFSASIWDYFPLLLRGDLCQQVLSVIYSVTSELLWLAFRFRSFSNCKYRNWDHNYKIIT